MALYQGTVADACQDQHTFARMLPYRAQDHVGGVTVPAFIRVFHDWPHNLRVQACSGIDHFAGDVILHPRGGSQCLASTAYIFFSVRLKLADNAGCSRSNCCRRPLSPSTISLNIGSAGSAG